MNYRSFLPSLRTRKSITSLLISYLLLMMPIAPLAATGATKSRPKESAAPTSLKQASDAVNVKSPEMKVHGSAAGYAPAPFAAPLITATKTATFPDPDGNGKAEPGDTISYTVTISNTGTADATGVTFDDNPDPNTTLVPGSIQSSPVAVNDSYSAVGNVQISIPAPGVLTNDIDPDTGNNTGLTATGGTTSTNGGNVVINSDGSFTYNPPVGFTGSDTFTYTAHDASAITSTATVTITVSNTIWFINNTAAAGGDGRITSPFNSIAAYLASLPTKDPNDIIFLYSSANPYTGNFSLANGMQLIGQGVDLATATGITVPTGSNALPGASTNPDIDSTLGNTVTLGQNNKIRGLNLRNSAGIDLVGNNFGTLTTSAVGLTGTGRPLSLSTGTLAATFSVINSTSSSGGQGISLSGVAGTMTVTGGTTITNATTQGILVGTTTANIDFGNTSVTGGTDGVSLQSNSSGTRSFGTLSISGGSGIGFLHSIGGGAISVTGATTITNPTGSGMQISGLNADLSFAATTINKSSTAGSAISFFTNVGHSITFATLNITAQATGISAASGGGSINVTTAVGSQITAPQLIDISGMGGTMNFASLTSNTGPPSMPAIRVNGNSTCSISSGTTSITNPGNMGILLQSNTSASFNFGNTTVSGSGSTGVQISSNGSGGVTFGALNISPSANQEALVISGNGGTISSTSGTISSTNNTALDISTSPLNMGLTSVSSTISGAIGNSPITLTTVTGTLTINGGAISGGGGTVFNVSGGSVNATYSGNITQNNAGKIANIASTTAGTIAFNTGTITGGSTNGGVNINAANGNVSFANLNLGTSGARMTNQAVTIAGGTGTYGLGTVSIFTSNATAIGSSTADGTINSTNGTVDASGASAVNITGPAGITTLGITLAKVTSTAGTANGIILSNTGGSFSVTGGAGPAAGTGGTIANKTGADLSTTQGSGVYLSNATNVSLAWMQLNDFQNNGIYGTNVTGFTLDHSVINGTNGTSAAGGSEEGSIRFDNLFGSAAISNSNISGAFYDNIHVKNSSGSLNRLTISNTTVGANSTLNGNDGVDFEAASGSATMNLTVQNSFFTSGRANLLVATNNGNGATDFVLRQNKFSNNHPNIVSAGGGVVIQGSASGANPTVTYDVSCNKFQDAVGTALVAFKGNGGGTTTGTIANNNIGVSGVALSGSKTGLGMDITANGTGTHTVLIRDNIILQYKQIGINLVALGNLPVGNGSSVLNASLFNNTIAQADPAAFEGILVDALGSNTDANVINIVMGSATIAGNKNTLTNTGPALGRDIRIRNAPLEKINISTNGSAKNTIPLVLADDNILSSAVSVTNQGTPPNINLVGTLPALPPVVAGCTLPAIVNPPAFEPLAGIQAPTETAPESQLPTVGTTTPNTVYLGAFQGVTGSAGATTRPAVLAPAFGVPATAGTASKPSTPANSTKSTTTGTNAKKGFAPLAPVGIVSRTIGTLSPGQSVTITFQVTVNNPFPGGVTQVSNQGTVWGFNFSNVLTDDPNVVGPANPTITPISSPNQISINDASTVKPTSGTKTMLFTVTLPSATGSTFTVNYATAADSGGANPATAGTDYTATSGTVTFNAGEQVKTIPVTILASGSVVDKTFLVNISGATGGTIIRPQAKGTIKATRTPSIALISEFRTSGPGGAGDDFVEVYNNTATPLTVGGTGWAVVKSGASCGSSPQIVGIIPNGTVIPVGGHYLLTGSQYSLGAPNGYPAGTAGTGKADGDLVMTSDIDADSNIGLFSASTVAALSSTNLLDAAGSGTGNICDLLEEGTPLLPALGSSSEYSFVRKLTTGAPQDTDDNFTDFAVVSTTATSAVGSNAAPLLGAPGPENLSSPPILTGLTPGLIDPAQAATNSPNRVRDMSPYTDNLSNTGAYPLGTFVIRRSYTNTTGHTVTRLRFRLIDVTAFPSPAGTADIRGITSPASQPVTITGGGSVTVIGTALEPGPGGFPAQPNGGGINSSMTVPLGLPLANGQSINVQWLLGVKQGGTFRFFVLIEGLAP